MSKAAAFSAPARRPIEACCCVCRHFLTPGSWGQRANALANAMATRWFPRGFAWSTALVPTVVQVDGL